jgi:hypothetical protein
MSKRHRIGSGENLKFSGTNDGANSTSARYTAALSTMPHEKKYNMSETQRANIEISEK